MILCKGIPLNSSFIVAIQGARKLTESLHVFRCEPYRRQFKIIAISRFFAPAGFVSWLHVTRVRATQEALLGIRSTYNRGSLNNLPIAQATLLIAGGDFGTTLSMGVI